jgi:predicted AlkP superfamily phosphohydrolase/phosphomutase
LTRQENAASAISKAFEWGASKVAFTPLARQIRKIKALDKVAQNVLDTWNNREAASIDFSHSYAYALGHTIVFGGIYLHLQDKDPEGIIKKQRRVLLITEIKEKLTQACHQAGHTIEFYPSRVVDSEQSQIRAPDILFSVDDWACVVSNKTAQDPLFEETAFSERHEGTHRMDGIILAWGPDVVPGSLEKAHLWDIVPTILAGLGAPIPVGLDGRVLPIYHSEMLDSITENWGDREDSPIPAAELVSSEVEEEAVIERLKGLGYL